MQRRCGGVGTTLRADRCTDVASSACLCTLFWATSFHACVGSRAARRAARPVRIDECELEALASCMTHSGHLAVRRKNVCTMSPATGQNFRARLNMGNCVVRTSLNSRRFQHRLLADPGSRVAGNPPESLPEVERRPTQPSHYHLPFHLHCATQDAHACPFLGFGYLNQHGAHLRNNSGLVTAVGVAAFLPFARQARFAPSCVSLSSGSIASSPSGVEPMRHISLAHANSVCVRERGVLPGEVETAPFLEPRSPQRCGAILQDPPEQDWCGRAPPGGSPLPP